MILLRGILLLLWITFAVCQTTHTVIVGQDGSFYDPATLAAVAGDTVQFVFEGLGHTVVQSNFTHPCVPLPGGFSSGIAGTNLTGTPTPPPVWNLLITDDTQPIWFFCVLTMPSSHCGQGMVGVINAPSIPQYQQFKASAQAVSGTPKPSLFVALSGIGAVATKAPSIVPGLNVSSIALSMNATSTLSSTSPSNTSIITTPSSAGDSATPPSSDTTHKKIGAIVGGAVGGLVIIVGSIILATICISRRRKSQLASDGFFDYRPHTMARQGPAITDPFSASKYGTTASMTSNSGPGVLVPIRRQSLEQETMPSISEADTGTDIYRRNLIAEDSQSKGGSVARDMADFLANTRMTGHPYQNVQGSLAQTPIAPLSPRPLPVFPYANNVFSKANDGSRREDGSFAYNPNLNRDSLVDRLETESPAPPLYR